ncbi:DUF1275 domain-containing protein [Paenibacillus sp. CAA11]|uniref:YoaK family protein n=1 Tax=Paenibacillus sp. CAA11 TaxID=1532905 RepID=UPI000D3A5B07|nr:YoaK family protein [Paenibacillus sp. CAA11]AWB43639.1 DUF1275 domain-containing protein [Paenibacillus sp. CAA11]
MNTIKQMMHLHKITTESLRLGILLAIVGGYLDAYTFVGRDGVFANAQTGNIVLLAVGAAEGNWSKALIQIPPIIAFILGVIVAEMIKKHSTHRSAFDFARAILITESLILFAIGFVPDSVPNIVVTVTISFVASLQVSAFRKLIDSPYASTMCTGNLRSASQEAFSAFMQKDPLSAMRAIRYGTIILFFIGGAVIGGLFTLHVGAKAVWGAAIVLAGSFILFTKEERHPHNSVS